MFRIVICRPDLVRFLMRELPLNRIRMPALLVEQRRRHAPKPVSGHLCVRIPESTERSVDRVVAHRSIAVSFARKYEPPVASQWLKFTKDFDCLGRERHVVMGPHLHASRRNTPFALSKVEFGPFSHPQFTRPHKDEWRQTQRATCNERSLVTVDRPKQRTNSLRLDDARVVPLDDGIKGTNQVASDVAFCATGSDGVPEYPTAILKGAVRGLIAPALFNALYHRQQLKRLDISDRILFEPGEDVALKA